MMVGPQPVDIEELDIGDHVKVVSEDESFEAVIISADPNEGITFQRISDGVEFIIDFMDLSEYDFYPRGKTVREVAERRRVAQKEQLLEKNHSSGKVLKESKVLEKSKTPLTEAEKKDQEEIENIFFILFDELQNTALGDQNRADGIIEKMKGLSENNIELQDALLFVLNQRNTNVKEAEMV
jgi:hypothetical protein